MIKEKLSYNPNFVIHPGKSLKDELEFLSLSQVELSRRTGLSNKHISQIINGADPITSDTAIKLELVLGGSAAFWSNLQKNYDLNLARIASEKRITDEIDEAKKFTCYNELVKLNRVKKTNKWNERTSNLLRFFGVNSLLYVQNTQPIAFRQSSGKFNKHSLAAWLRCGEVGADISKVPAFNKKKARKIIREIRKLTLLPDDFGCKLKELCASVGIIVVYTPYFKNTKVNGSTRWIGDKALIQLNTKGAFSDIFWFTFFHELGHVLLHGIRDKFLDYQGKKQNQKEREADDFATEALIKFTDYKRLIVDIPLNEQKVRKFAKSIGVSPSIVLGRLAHEKKVSWRRIAHLRSKLVIEI